MTVERAQADTGLVKGLGLFDATTIVMGSMIGSGIFIVSADIARQVRLYFRYPDRYPPPKRPKTPAVNENPARPARPASPTTSSARRSRESALRSDARRPRRTRCLPGGDRR